MKNKKVEDIPEVSFSNRLQKNFEFDVVTNHEVLRDNIPSTHNPFRPARLHFYSILFILKGKGKHFIDFKTYNYKRGSIIFIAKDQVHAFERNVDRKAIFFIFTEKFLEKSNLGSNLMQQINLYNYHLYPPILQLEESEISFFETLARRIRQEYYTTEDFATEEIIASLLKIFLLTAERIRKKKTYVLVQSNYYPTFLAFQKLVQENLLQNRKVQFYAQALNISTKKLNRIVQEIMNKPVKEYIHEQLIMEIKRFLMNTDLSIKEIAYKTGFDEPTNFVKYFKKNTSSTPSAFRKDF